ncbi:MAG: amino acid transporter [Gemmataceae bacterium]|nr:amino acid transporter [Gemmataceae bacterium]
MATDTHSPKGAGSASPGHPQSFWLWVMCLTGVDYFSTLGYQPSIAFEATGLLTPFATVILVLVTLFGALPVYAHVAAKSPHGQGSIAMLEKLVHGWTGKLLVLVLLGFAATDFVITKTLSAADAAAHIIQNPLCKQYLTWDHTQMMITMFLLVILGATFMRGLKEVIGMAVGIVGVYLVLNLIVVGSSLAYLWDHIEHVDRWLAQVEAGKWHFEHDFGTSAAPLHIVLICVILFPKLALGLSGFETGVAVMPLIRGDSTDSEKNPAGRIRSTRRLLILAAVIMSLFLLGSSLVVSTLIAPEALAKHGLAHDRALAYLAHGENLIHNQPSSTINSLFGGVFGTIYDMSTVVILWFAGASAMAGLLNLVPQYLPRYGMAPGWAGALRPLVIMFTVINLFVTWQFNASVEAQGSAYATGVLVLMSSACIATLIDRWRARSGVWFFRLSWPFALITVVFLYTTLANMIEKPDGLLIAIWFILAIVLSSIVSRFLRSKEMRSHGMDFVAAQSRFLWDSMKMLEFPVLVPHRPGSRSIREKEESIRKEHRLGPDVPVVFIEANLGDASDFLQTPLMEVIQEEGVFILRINRCASIAHTIAALALELSKAGAPPEIHFGWSDQNPLSATIGFLLFGEGNVPWMVRELIRDAEPNPERQPRVVIG